MITGTSLAFPSLALLSECTADCLQECVSFKLAENQFEKKNNNNNNCNASTVFLVRGMCVRYSQANCCWNSLHPRELLHSSMDTVTTANRVSTISKLLDFRIFRTAKFLHLIVASLFIFWPLEFRAQ